MVTQLDASRNLFLPSSLPRYSRAPCILAYQKRADYHLSPKIFSSITKSPRFPKQANCHLEDFCNSLTCKGRKKMLKKYIFWLIPLLRTIVIVNPVWLRVDMVGMNHNKVLTQWRHMPMGQFRANIFLIQITSTYFWASEVFKNRRF